MWLNPHRAQVLQMAGYPATHVLAEPALRYAETAIEAYTGCVWGSTRTETIIIRLTSLAMTLLLPPDTQSVNTINGYPMPTGTNWVLTKDGLYRLEGGALVHWQPGHYAVELVRGRTQIPFAVLKAASLLANAYLNLSDAQRSQFEQASRGDISYRMRFSQLIAPEAETWLGVYRNAVGGALV